MFVTEVTFVFYHCLSLAKNKNEVMEEVKCVRNHGLVVFITMPWAMTDIGLDAASVGDI